MGDFPDLSPKDNTDYFKVIFWLISRRLAYVMVSIVILLSIGILILLNPPGWIGDRGYHVYNYDSFLLRFKEGTAGIRAADGHIAYIGAVSKGGVNGKGTLYEKDGKTRYKGEFEGNVYQGKGILYRDSGIMEYAGEFAGGVKQGEGELYNEDGSKVYNGSFWNDQIVYEELVGKKTEEISEKYTGRRIVYAREEEICVGMPEIRALYFGRDKSDSLDEAWTADGIYVLRDSIAIGSDTLTSIDELTDYFGVPTYQGNTFADFGDRAAMELLDETKLFRDRPALGTTLELNDVYTVNEMAPDYEVYIYTYENEGIQYTFFTKKQSEGFEFYLIT